MIFKLESSSEKDVVETLKSVVVVFFFIMSLAKLMFGTDMPEKPL